MNYPVSLIHKLYTSMVVFSLWPLQTLETTFQYLTESTSVHLDAANTANDGYSGLYLYAKVSHACIQDNNDILIQVSG